jgi:hypothetical protein
MKTTLPKVYSENSQNIFGDDCYDKYTIALINFSLNNLSFIIFIVDEWKKDLKI